jgi:hypothetical protein
MSKAKSIQLIGFVCHQGFSQLIIGVRGATLHTVIQQMIVAGVMWFLVNHWILARFT